MRPKIIFNNNLKTGIFRSNAKGGYNVMD